MARLFSNRNRLFDLGVLPTERLLRDAGAASVPARQPGDAIAAGPDSMAGAVPEYRPLFDNHLDGAVASARAPVPGDPAARSKNLKATAYFLDATLAGVCRLEAGDWPGGEPLAHPRSCLPDRVRAGAEGQRTRRRVDSRHQRRSHRPALR